MVEDDESKHDIGPRAKIKGWKEIPQGPRAVVLFGGSLFPLVMVKVVLFSSRERGVCLHFEVGREKEKKAVLR